MWGKRDRETNKLTEQSQERVCVEKKDREGRWEKRERERQTDRQIERERDRHRQRTLG